MDENKDRIKELEQRNSSLQKELDKRKQLDKEATKTKIWLLKKIGIFFIGVGLKDSISNFLNEFSKNGKVSKDTISDLITSLIKRFTRIGVFTFLIAITPIVILIIQTTILNNQNELFEKQNVKIEQQNYLMEAARRSSQVFIMGDVAKEISEEIKNIPDSNRELSQVLQSRIISLTLGMRPYRYIDYDGVIQSPISPERGQLFILLMQLSLSDYQFLLRADFTYSDLRNMKLLGKNLTAIKLNYANMEGIELNKCRFLLGKFKHSNLKSAILDRCVFTLCHFENANCEQTNFTGSYLLGSSFRYANLKGSNLSNTTLERVNFKDVKSLDSVIVDRSDWLIYIKDSLKLEGSSEIFENYEIKRKHIGKVATSEYLILRK
jgi:hypothetical protein